jgi:hypothetical protein
MSSDSVRTVAACESTQAAECVRADFQRFFTWKTRVFVTAKRAGKERVVIAPE